MALHVGDRFVGKPNSVMQFWLLQMQFCRISEILGDVIMGGGSLIWVEQEIWNLESLEPRGCGRSGS